MKTQIKIMIKIGLTGGIGSGKSFVCGLLKKKGMAVYDCDAAAKEIMAKDQQVIASLKQLVGEHVYTSQGLDKTVMSAYLFASPEHAASVSSVVHPAVARGFEKFVASNQDAPACVLESAILFESGLQSLVDKCVCVQAPLPMRISRVQQRDGLSESAIRQRIARQMSEEAQEKLPVDFFILNDGQSDLEQQVQDMLCAFKLF